MNFTTREGIRAQLKAISAVSSNLIVVFVGFLLTTSNSFVRLFDIVLVILFWYVTIKAEEVLQDL